MDRRHAPGKNASAGAVVIVTKRPNRHEFEGKVNYTIAETMITMST